LTEIYQVDGSTRSAHSNAYVGHSHSLDAKRFKIAEWLMCSCVLVIV